MCLSGGQLTERERWKPEQNLRNRTDCGEPRDLEYWNPRHRAEPDRQPGQQLAGQLSSKDQESDARAWGRMPGLVSHLFQICIFIYLYK